jgi:PAS domain S-box/diguanylate cyclase (GGDEF) domain
MPVKSPRGHLLAVLVMHTGLEPINRIVRSRAGMGETGETYLVDDFNVMVASDRAGDAPVRRHAHNEGVLRALAGGNGYELYTNDAGVPVVGVYRWLPLYKMALVAEMSQAEAFAPAGRLALIIVLVGLVTVGGLAVGVLVVSRRVARPVLEVTRAAMAVADGDLSARAPVLTSDELGKLAVAFNTMTGELSTLYERLEQEGADRWAILQGSFDGIAMADQEGGIEYLNPGMENIFGYALHEMPSLAALAEHLFPIQEERQDFVSNLIADMRESSPPERLYRFLHRDGSTRWCRFQVAPMHGGRVVINAQDITDIKNSEEQVRHMALHDTLTGLPNRQLFADRLDQAIRRAKRLGVHVSLLYVDLDKFKGLNDTYGHAHGDRVLVETAKRLLSSVRESDTVARLGGDEFVVILADQQQPADALPVARKILDRLHQPEEEGGCMFLGASVGLACYPLHGVDQDSLLNAADAAMYVAKRAGGNSLGLAEGFPHE